MVWKRGAMDLGQQDSFFVTGDFTSVLAVFAAFAVVLLDVVVGRPPYIVDEKLTKS